MSQEQEALALPHPSLPQPNVGFNRHSRDEWLPSRWVSLSPNWIDLEEEDFSRQVEDALLSQVAAALALEAQERQALAAALRPSPVLVDYHLEGPTGDLLLGREALTPGQPAAFADLDHLAGIRDFDVEIASGSGIADPIIAQRAIGASLAMRLRPAGTSWLAEVALVRTQAASGDPIPMHYAQLAGKDRLVTMLSEGGSSLLMAPGELKTMQLPSLDGGLLQLSLRVDQAPQPIITALPRGLVALRLLPEQTAPTLLTERLSRGLAWTSDDGLWLVSGSDAAATAQAALAAVSAPSSWELHLALSNSLDQEAAPVTVVSELVAGQPLCFAQGTLRDALVDWDVEVAQVARIADPVFADYFGGVRGQLTPNVLADGRLQLSGEVTVSMVDIGEAASLRLAAATAGESGYDGKVPVSPAHEVGVELPALHELSFRGTWEPDESGRVVLVRSAQGLLGPGARVKLSLQLTPR